MICRTVPEHDPSHMYAYIVQMVAPTMFVSSGDMMSSVTWMEVCTCVILQTHTTTWTCQNKHKCMLPLISCSCYYVVIVTVLLYNILTIQHTNTVIMLSW